MHLNNFEVIKKTLQFLLSLQVFQQGQVVLDALQLQEDPQSQVCPVIPCLPVVQMAQVDPFLPLIQACQEVQAILFLQGIQAIQMVQVDQVFLVGQEDLMKMNIRL